MQRFIAVLLAVFLSSVGEARWATLDDAPTVIESIREQYEVHADGTFELESETVESVRNEVGRAQGVNFAAPFSPTLAKVEVLEAKTISPAGVETNVPSNLIESKPMASSLNGFDDVHQLSIAYPGVEIGSRMTRKIKTKVTTASFPGFFSQRIYFGLDRYERKAEYVFRSEVPLFVEANDPWKRIEITHSRDGKWHVVSLKLTCDMYVRIVEEDSSRLAMSKMVWVGIATSDKYADLAKTVAPSYEAVLRAKLPKPFQDIVTEAKKQKTTIDKLNLVTTRLSEMVRYMGDWRTVHGRLIPHTLAEFAESKMGDCKDHAAAATAMFRALGITANVAAIGSGYPAWPLGKIPFDASFNHVIVRVKDGKNVYWVDPTVTTSFAQGLHEHLADRGAMILTATSGAIEQIPELKPDQAMYLRQYNVVANADRSVSVGARFDVIGRAATGWAGMGLSHSPESLNYYIRSALANDKAIRDVALDPIDLTSRVVKDVTLSGNYTLVNAQLKTSAGRALPLETHPKVTTIMTLAVNDREGDLVLNAPALQQTTYRILGSVPAGGKKLGCSIATHWLSLDRKVRHTKKDTIIDETLTLWSGVIPVEELRTPEFRQLQDKLLSCYDGVAVVLRAPPKPKVATEQKLAE